jgi:hypothetical protein
MALSSLAFYAMAFRVPVVSIYLPMLSRAPTLTLSFSAKTTLPYPDCLHHHLRLPLLLRYGRW